MSFERVNIPAEFYDRTSSMLLKKPEPQYLYATFIKRALDAQLTVPDDLGHPDRKLSGVGADYVQVGDDRLTLEQDMISESVLGANIKMDGEPGHTVRVNRPLFTDSTYTLASRTIARDVTISTTPIPISSEQNSVTLVRLAGPYGTSAVQPYSLDNLDTQVGVHKASKIAGLHLQRDYDKTLEGIMIGIFDTGTAIYPNGFTADNDFATSGAAPFSYDFISQIERKMDDASLPVLPDGKRLLVVPPAAGQGLKTDPQFTRLSEFHKEVNALFPGTYFRSIGNFHIFKSATLSKPTNTSSIPVYRAHAIAPGAIGVGMGKPPQTAYSNDDNYGITAKIIWMAFMGFKLFDSSFIYTARFTDV
jgi:hypothetical protein